MRKDEENGNRRVQSSYIYTYIYEEENNGMGKRLRWGRGDKDGVEEEGK